MDLLDKPALAAAVGEAGAEGVVHLAAQSSPSKSFTDPEGTFQANVMGTLNLLRALEQSGFKGPMLYVSSSDVYGLVEPADLPLREEHPLRPRNPYAASKAAGEALVYQWSRTGPFPIVIARPFNHTGPGQSEAFVLPGLARRIARAKTGEGEARLPVGDLEVTRDFSDVRDVIEAYMLLLEKGRNGEAYNICSGVERSIGAIMDELLELAGMKAGVDIKIEREQGRLRRAEQRRVVGSAEKLHRETGWSPAVPWRNTLLELLEYWERELR